MSHERDDIVSVGGGGNRGVAERSRRIAIGAAVAVVAMLGGAAVAFAATNATASPSAPAVGASSSPAPKPAPPKCPNSHGPGRQFVGPFHRFGAGPGDPFGFGFAGGMFGVVHGQVVVSKPGGGYQTVDIQRGIVTSVSTSSITLRSKDGFTASYAVTASTMVDAQRDGIGSVKVGNQVSVLASASGAKATAISIMDLTLLQQGRESMSYG